MLVRVLVGAAVGVTILQKVIGENIAFGKTAKQSTTHGEYNASIALDEIYSNRGSTTGLGNPSWWEVDLRGYFSISNITLTAVDMIWNLHMRNAFVEVMDKDVSLCSDVQVAWCGNVSSTVASEEEFTFTCNATFPVRFVRVTRPGNDRLNIGHIDVQGVVATQRYRSHFTSTANRKVSFPSLATSAVTAGACGILCHKSHSCIDFSYRTAASTEANCLLTYEEVPLNSVADHAWRMYTLASCL
ncbi:uncharacterized protein LOC124145122 [Haliotis rufescens]|uniref:uncharacterized protein LOC124145122 n=1 Tax=Haliotis rufescens TaxID=6454 RepID=UPI00201F43AC|nr:uncharacterized protein LOC124145122 [Haliotis rufescens]